MTNEEYVKAIEMRRSRRTYRPKPLSGEITDTIKQLIDEVNGITGLELQFVENGNAAFKIFTGKFSYIAVCGQDTEKARIQSGYYGEIIALQCVYHGLGTCWVTGTYDENKVYEAINLPKRHRLYAVIVVGYVKEKLSAKEKIMYNATHKQNKPYQKMLDVCDRKLPPYYENAMKLVEKAPSSTNRRIVRFRYDKGIMSAYVDEPYSVKSLELGIAQLHFCIGAAAKGLKGEWDSSGRFCPNGDKVIKFPESEESRLIEENENENTASTQAKNSTEDKKDE